MTKPVLAVFFLAIAAGCHSAASKPAPVPLFAVDTNKVNTDPGNPPPPAGPIILKTHLRDTSIVSGNFILFLVPDQQRFEMDATDSTYDGEYESDSDFGAGIGNTMDSVKANHNYKSVTVLTSPHRYIVIKDCKGGPLVIDRDTVNYGYILSGKGKSITTTYNSVHSGDYLGEISEYFGLPAPKRDY